MSEPRPSKARLSRPRPSEPRPPQSSRGPSTNRGQATDRSTRYATLDDVDDFPTDAYLRAARAFADFSQRELAQASGLPPWLIARLESEPRLARVQTFARALDACGLRLAVTYRDSYEFASEYIPVDGERRDRAGRRFPAHLDVRPAQLGWWGSGWPMFQGKEPTFTFDRARWRRDMLREDMVKQYAKLRAAEEAQRQTDQAQRQTDQTQRQTREAQRHRERPA